MKLLPATLTTFAMALALSASALAHKASDAYLQLRTEPAGLELRLDVALRDLDATLDLDADADGRLTWGEVQRAWPAIVDYTTQRVHIDGCTLSPGAPGLEQRSDGAYAVLWLRSPCRPVGEPVIDYRLFRDVDATHRGIARIDVAGAGPVVRVLDPAAVPRPSREAEPASFVAEGVRHILTGYDHVLFLLCLLLPAVMRRVPARDGAASGWQPVNTPWQALLPVAGIVTAFTVAHSITLALAALGGWTLPSSVIEPAIAATIVLAALDNFWPLFRGRRGTVTFLFGLIHGFGFAGVLAELELPTAQFVWALLQFNFGLELGQLTIVGAALGTLYFLRSSPRYPAWVIRGGSAAVMAMGGLWFLERTVHLTLPW